ncbi:hypothetical protein LshimejAT787_0310290 [Lyophyllum shimeji]|uniref:Uncharacterized protein n=1 Tax=Lyophyllum shimeji TaxID=47721 RepID=A0A9P3PIE2_LYOSH|nr:hypothetical protein LshimejAT787_0310290 [Lyophyllum shimeji]
MRVPQVKVAVVMNETHPIETQTVCREDSADSSSDVFFNPNPKVDYQALKRLLRQLFQRDADIFQLHELAELVLRQPTVARP